MARLRVQCFTISIDGYGAGPGQDHDNPLGIGGTRLHEWQFDTRTFNRTFGGDGGTTGVDDELVAAGAKNVGAWVIGRNMFGPIRGPWPDEDWRGWWGEEPPYRVPVFILTRHPRDSIAMKGGTVFHFVTDGIEAALERAFAAAGDKDVRLGGGVSTIRQYLEARLVDELHLAIAPVLLGTGEHLLAGLNLPDLGYHCTRLIAGEKAAHVVLGRSDGSGASMQL